MKAEEKALELYPIEDFPFREDAESQYKLRAAFLKGVEFAQMKKMELALNKSRIANRKLKYGKGEAPKVKRSKDVEE
jgi:hypothetical protein